MLGWILFTVFWFSCSLVVGVVLSVHMLLDGEPILFTKGGSFWVDVAYFVCFIVFWPLGLYSLFWVNKQTSGSYFHYKYTLDLTWR